MDKIFVTDLATEFELAPAQVVTELKKLGVFVTAHSAVDGSIVERVRKRLQSIHEAAVAEATAKAEKTQAKEKEKPAEHVVKAPRRVAAKPAVEAPVATEVEAEKAVARRAVKKAATEPVVAKPMPPAAKPVAKKAPVKAAAKAVEDLAAAAHPLAKPRRVPHAKVEVPAPLAAPVVPVVLEIIEPPIILPEGPPPAEVVAVSEAAATAPLIEPPRIEIPGEEEPTPAVEKPESKVELPVTERVPQPKPVPAKPLPRLLKKTAADATPIPAEVPGKIFRAIPPRPLPSRRPMPPRRFDGRKRTRPEESSTALAEARIAEAQRRPVSPEEYRPVDLTEGLTVKELSEKLEVKTKEIIKSLMKRGVLATINHRLEGQALQDICGEYGFRPVLQTFEEELMAKEKATDRVEDYMLRAPVVTIMGHVDHGKTSLLDAIRETRVTEMEAGGITQHIGAYQVRINERPIVFLDTPGHEAFTMMRARGAQSTDIVVLVVAADDGVMPQTLEAIHHARAAGVPMIVAINKIDKPEAQPDRIRQQLSDQGLMPEEWGGDTVMVNVSAKKKQNLDLLLEMILLVADMRDLKANPARPGSGVVLEAKLDRGRGPVATVLVQNGTLRIGDYFLAGAVYGRVRAMFSDRGGTLREAPPATPVEVLGLDSLPQAGDSFHVIEDTDRAKEIGAYRQEQMRQKALQRTSRVTLSNLFDRLRSGESKELPLILKADVQGSVEVLTETLNKLSSDRVKIRLLHSGAGAITESDVLLASASNAIIVGFSVRPERAAHEMAEREGVDIRLHTVIYDISNEIKSAMTGLLETTTRERHLGTASIRNVFRIPKAGTIAGSYVTEGIITRNAQARLLRDNVVIFEGRIDSLRRFKEDAQEVRQGFECGIHIERFSDIKVGDIIEAFVVEKVTPEPLFETVGRKS